MQGLTLLSAPRPGLDVKTEMAGWRLGMLMGMVWLCVPRWELIRHTKPLSRQPAGKQLACRKRSARVGLQPNLGLFQHGRRSSLVFHFICTRRFMSGPQTGVCVCVFSVVLFRITSAVIYLLVEPLGSGQGFWSSSDLESPLRVDWRCYCSIHSGGNWRIGV